MTDVVLKPDRALTEEVKGRSLWQDAWNRLLRNHAAVVSGIVLIIILLLSFVGPYFVPHSVDDVNWDYIDSPPNFAAGYYFGTDQNGRDLLVRTFYGGRVSITIGLVATLVSLVIGVSWGALADDQTNKCRD